MEPYRRDTAEEPDRDPDTGHLHDSDGTPGDRAGEADAVDDEARNDKNKQLAEDNDDLQVGPDPAHGSEQSDLSDPLRGTDHDGSDQDRLDSERDDVSGLDHPVGDAEEVKRDESDVMVYPEEADYPTQTEDDSLTAGVPDLEPAPVLVTSGHHHGTGTDAGSADFQQRWREVQAGFVDDPRDAVERADQLVEEAMTALTTRRQGLVDRWKNSDQNDTEQLRLALRDYRSLLEELVGLSSSTAGQGSLPALHEAR